MDFLFFLQWWNLIYELPFLAALLYIGLLASGTVSPGHGEGDIGHDISHVLHLDHDVSHDGGHPHDHPDHDVDEDAGVFVRVLYFFGIGRVPLSIVMLSFLLIWSFTGWASNLLLSRWFPQPVFIVISFALATIVALILTRYIAIGLAKVMPSLETYGVSQQELGGSHGTAKYGITQSFGRAQVYDRFGNLQEVNCRLLPGGDSIPAGVPIRLLEYNTEGRFYTVVREADFRTRFLKPR